MAAALLRCFLLLTVVALASTAPVLKPKNVLKEQGEAMEKCVKLSGRPALNDTEKAETYVNRQNFIGKVEAQINRNCKL